MYALYIYLETLIFMTFYIPLEALQQFLRILGDTSEWYAKNRVHVWQPTKASIMMDEQFGKYKDLVRKHPRKSKKGPRL